MTRMHDPPHPGEIIKELCLEPLGLSVTDAAKGLGVTRKALSEPAQRPYPRAGNGDTIGTGIRQHR